MQTSSTSSYSLSPFAVMMYVQVIAAFVYFQVKFQPWLIEYISSL